jgi:AP2 domain
MNIFHTIKQWFNPSINIEVEPVNINPSILQELNRALLDVSLINNKAPKELKQALAEEIRELRTEIKRKTQLLESITKRPKTSKYKGVCFNAKSQRWIASITHKGITKYLGTFDDELDAHNCFIQYKEQLNNKPE